MSNENSRILGRIEFVSKEEKQHYYKKAKELGYSSFKEFAKATMDKEIRENNFIYASLEEIAELAATLQQQIEPPIIDIEGELSDDEEQALSVADLIYKLAVHTNIMINAPENQVYIDSPELLDIDEKPYWRNKHALGGFDIEKYLEM